MDRRRFVGASLAAPAAAALSACAPAGEPDAETSSGERSAAGATRPDAFELDEATVADLQAAMESGERTARSIAQLYLERIESLNRRGPELGAVIETNPDALDIAAELDRERRANGPRSPLHGIPVALKDNVDTRDGMTTTAGSLALEGSVPPRDAFIVERLREAGAVVLAKLNLSEWANFRGERSSSGWSARGGQTRNPYALDRNPCGSSSGSAVAASANLAALTIGTETNGSIVCPSSANGIVGVKPTVGLWSRSGIVPISRSQDTAGPMCRTVRDAAVLLASAIGVDADDPATAFSQGQAHGDYVRLLDPGALAGARIGVAGSFPGFSPDVLALFDEAVDALRSEGAAVVETETPVSASWRDDAPLLVLEYEFKAGVDAYLASLGPDAPVKSLAEIIDFNERNADVEMPHFGQERLIASQERGPLTDRAYLDALASIRRATREDGIDATMDRHGLDAIAAPSRGLAWKTDHILGDRLGGGSSAGPAAIAGYPHVTVPMGRVSGLPAGLSFFGRRWSEPVLLRLAYAYEQSTGHRSAPTFRETLG